MATKDLIHFFTIILSIHRVKQVNGLDGYFRKSLRDEKLAWRAETFFAVVADICRERAKRPKVEDRFLNVIEETKNLHILMNYDCFQWVSSVENIYLNFTRLISI
jgi:hypothetical protein